MAHPESPDSGVQVSDITITARCLCKRHAFTVTVPKSSLPLDACCCHCDSCRHLTGALYFSDTEWPDPEEDLSALKKYSFSKTTDIFSCGKCSSQLFCKGTGPGDKPCVMTGVLDNVPGLLRYTNHIFVGDTLDGGASVWLRRNWDGSAARCWRGRVGKSEELGVDSSSLAAPSVNQTQAPPQRPSPSPSVTPLRCCCGGVNLGVRSAHDIIESHRSESHSSESSQNRPGLPLFVDQATGRYKANTDVCDSCRLSFGVDLVSWTFASLTHIDYAPPKQRKTKPEGEEDQEVLEEETGPTAGGSPAKGFPQSVSALKEAVDAVDRDARLGTLTYYSSSEHVERYFCGTCSASVFYAVHDRPSMVDIALGLLEHPDGARAEGLLAWTFGVVGWKGDVAGGWREALVKSVEEEAKEWSKGRQGWTGSSAV